MSGGTSSSHNQSQSQSHSQSEPPPVFGCPSSPTFSTTLAAGNLFAQSNSTSSSCTRTISATPSVAMAPFPSTTAQSAFGLSTTPSFGNPVFTGTTQGIGSSSLSYPTSSFGNTNPTESPVFGCAFSRAPTNPAPTSIFNFFSTPTPASAPAPAPGFDFSITPLHCFLNFPPTTSASPSRTPSIFNKLTPPSIFDKPTFPSGGHQLTPTLQVWPRCRHDASLRGQHWGNTPTPAPELDSLVLSDPTLNSISAMPIYNDKSHEELRWQDYKSQGKAQGRVTPACKSATSGQPLLALPVFVLPAVIPTFSNSGSGFVPWTPSTVGSCCSTHSGTTVPAFAASPTLLGVPWTNASVLGQPSFSTSSSTPVMAAVFPLCEMFRWL